MVKGKPQCAEKTWDSFEKYYGGMVAMDGFEITADGCETATKVFARQHASSIDDAAA